MLERTRIIEKDTTISRTMNKINDSDRIIFVNIKKSYEAFLNHDTKNPFYRPSVYDCTVKYWRVDDEKAHNATHIIGCYKGIVKEVVKVTEPPKIDTENIPGRKVFTGIEQPDSPYMNLDIRTIFDNLTNFHTKYYNL